MPINQNQLAPADAAGFYHVLAPAKINLFLHVLGKMADGYHALQSAFVMLKLADNIALRLREDSNICRINDIVGVSLTNDLTLRAARLLQQETGVTKGVDINVHKNIPIGAGLGGGSSDAASVLLALNIIWKTNLSRQALQRLALKLGADVPFFIFGQTAWAEGRGEKLTPLAIALPDFAVVVPPIHILTANIFSDPYLLRNTPAKLAKDFASWFEQNGINKHPHLGGWKNDLQEVAERQHPALQTATTVWQEVWAKEHEATPPLMMTGSGAGYFAPLHTFTANENKAVDEGRQRALKAYNSHLFLRGFYWHGKAITYHPLIACSND